FVIRHYAPFDHGRTRPMSLARTLVVCFAAVVIANFAPAEEPQSVDEFVERGWEHLYAQRGGDAKAAFDAALRLDANSTSARYGRGIGFIIADEPKKAIADFDEIIRLSPLDADAYAA